MALASPRLLTDLPVDGASSATVVGAEPAALISLLERGDVSLAMQTLVESLSAGVTRLEDVRRGAAWRQLRDLVLEGDWFERLAPRRAVSLPRRPASAVGRAIDAWMHGASRSLSALAARDRYLSSLVGDSGPATPVIGVSGRRLQVLAPALGGLQSAGVHTVNASLHSLLSREYHAFGCALVVVPLLPGTLARDAHEALLHALAGWLQPGGELVVAALSRVPEAGFLQAMLGWRPAEIAPDALLRLGASVFDVVASVSCDHAEGVCYLHLQRR